MSQNDVLHRKSILNIPPDEEEGMHISKFLIAGALYVGTMAALERPFSLELSGPHPGNEGAIRRIRTVVDGELTAVIPKYPQILTVYDLVRNAVNQWRDKECLGSRKLVRQHEETKNLTKMINGVEQQVPKKWLYSELSPFEYRSYRDLGEESQAIGAGLRKLGLKPGDHVELYADTSYSSFVTLLMSDLNGKSLLKDA
jgi:long-chain acyl-CoA synthetase